MGARLDGDRGQKSNGAGWVTATNFLQSAVGSRFRAAAVPTIYKLDASCPTRPEAVPPCVVPNPCGCGFRLSATDGDRSAPKISTE